MAILDLQNYLSNPASGDTLAAIVSDIPGGQVIDQNVLNGLFTGPAGAEIAPWVTAKIATALASAGAATIQAVIQDSPNNVTWTDEVLGPVTTLANATANTIILLSRLNRSMQRYIRIVWRIGGATTTAGIGIAFINLDTDQIDLSMRKATTTITIPTGASDESIANGVLQG